MKIFVVRVWTPPDPAEAVGVGLRGLVEQVGSSCSSAFGKADALVGLLRQAVRAHAICVKVAS